jgi:hypothetical protein
VPCSAAASVLTSRALAAARGHGRLPVDLAVLLFTGLVAGWVVLPILTFGSDDLLDPARLALLPLTGPEFLIVMGAGALVGIAPVATVVAALGLVPATARRAGVRPGGGAGRGAAGAALRQREPGLLLGAVRAAALAPGPRPGRGADRAGRACRSS